jgi:hypothetical protein
LLDANSVDADSVGQGGEAGVFEIGAVGHDAGGLHFQFDEGESAVVEDDDLDGELALEERKYLDDLGVLRIELGYGKSVPSMSRTSQCSMERYPELKPMRPVRPTLNGLSNSMNSLPRNA